jgi:hypothetical protein
MARKHRSEPMGNGRRWGFLLAILGLTFVVSIVAWSPLLMHQLLGDSLPWPTLANVGEAYGGASALLSAAALCGIGISLLFQSRQTRQELMSLHIQRHFDLIRLALDNPEFFEVIDGIVLDDRSGRQKVYANLTLNYWMTMWELGEIGEATLRNLTTGMFRSPIAREWWSQVHETWTTVRGRRRRQFIRIVHEVWKSANVPAHAAHDKRAAVHSSAARRWSTVMVWSAVAAIAAGTTASRRRRRY